MKKGYEVYVLNRGTNPKPFTENQKIGYNNIWMQYGEDKVEAENYLRDAVPGAYILRPPYLYGPMQNIYREPFVFGCALLGRKFYIPGDGRMKLQFFHVEMCYEAVGKALEKVYVTNHRNQRDYFSFYDYEYILDLTRQKQLLPDTKSLQEGLRESFEWYRSHPDEVKKKAYIQFIKEHFE